MCTKQWLIDMTFGAYQRVARVERFSPPIIARILPWVAAACLLVAALLPSVAAATTELVVTQLGGTTATVQLIGHTGNWWYSGTPPMPECSGDLNQPFDGLGPPVGGPTLTVTGLTTGNQYTIEAWPNNQCAPTTQRLDDVTFTPGSVTLNVTNIGTDTATVGIVSHTGEWWYHVTPPGVTTPDCHRVASETATGTVSNLTQGTVYSAFAYTNSTCSGDPFAVKTFSTLLLSAPEDPTKPIVTRGDEVVSLAWTPRSDGGSTVTKWQYQQKVGTGQWGSWIDVPNSTETTNSYTVTGLTNGTTYQFKVRAVNAIGNGAESAASDAVVPATTPPAPSKPTVSRGNGSVTLTWTSNGNGGSAITKWQYRQKADTGSYGAWTDIPGSGPATTSYTVTGLTNGIAYQFKVRAVNDVGNGAESAESASVTPATTPPAPSKPTVSPGNRSVTLTWSSTGTGGSPITKWQYQQKAGNGPWGPWTDICKTSEDTNCPNTTTYTVTGLTNGTTYQFKVRAVNDISDDIGTASEESTPVTPMATPPAPSQPTATGSPGRVTLT